QPSRPGGRPGVSLGAVSRRLLRRVGLLVLLAGIAQAGLRAGGSPQPSPPPPPPSPGTGPRPLPDVAPVDRSGPSADAPDKLPTAPDETTTTAEPEPEPAPVPAPAPAPPPPQGAANK